MRSRRHMFVGILAVFVACNAGAQATPEFKVPPQSSIPARSKGIAIQEDKKLLTEMRQPLGKNVEDG